jgi:2-polyprenyl-6-methoxyphenol hydroxylase-like FAD-dependent oxidoreductase
LGASLAGLAAAAALAERFHRVTIVERDALQPEGHRRGVPQGRHVHVLLPAGRVGLAELLPGVVDDLRSRDASVIDTTEVRFHIAGGSLLLDDDDLDIVSATRPLLESVVRDRVRARPGSGSWKARTPEAW